MTDILPQPSDDMPVYNPPEGQGYGLNKRTLWTLVAILIIALLCLLGAYIYDFSHNRSQDNTRKQDLSYISTFLNGYYELNHYYPTLSQLNSTTFGAFAPNLDRAKFSDPSSANKQLTAKPTTSSYAYEVEPTGCDNVTKTCSSYQLTAILSNGQDYVVTSPAPVK